MSKNMPVAWTVFNAAGAVACDGLSLHEVADYLTPDRMARGWNAVMCVDIRTEQQLQEALRANPAPAEPSAALIAAATDALAYMREVGESDMYPHEWAIVGRLEAALAAMAEGAR